MKVWLALLLPAVLGTLAVATAPVGVSGKFGGAAAVWAVYLIVVALILYSKDWLES